MSISHGLESPHWLAKMLIANAHPTLVKKAIIDVMDTAYASEDACVDWFELIDRLVQVSATGKYTPPEPEDEVIAKFSVNLDNLEDLPDDLEEEIRKFREQLGDLPEADDEESE